MVGNLKNTNPPDMSHVLDELKRDVALNMNCIQIGEIQSFDPSEQTANIRMAMRQVTSIAEDGTREIREYPLLVRCPVMTLFGGDSFISMPIEQGDNCIILFNDRQLDNWFISGVGHAPSLSRLHDLSDAIAIIGVRPVTNSIGAYLSDGIRIQYSDNVRIDLTSEGVSVNGNLTVNGVLSTDHDGTQVDYNTHTHGGVMTGGGNTGEPNDI